LPTAELAQLSEAGERFAKEGEAARAKAESSESENIQGTEMEVTTGKKLWMTGEFLLVCSWMQHVIIYVPMHITKYDNSQIHSNDCLTYASNFSCSPW